MKKYFLMMVMMFTMSMSSFADGVTVTNENVNIERYTMNVNVNQLASYIGLEDGNKIEDLAFVEEELHNDLIFVATECNEMNRKIVAKNAIDKHLKNVRYILNGDQYRKYLRVLNATIINRGILK